MPSQYGPVAVNVNTGALEYSASVGSGEITDGSIATADLADSAVTNAKVSASAAIAYSKLALTGAVLNADLAGSIAVSKLSGAPRTYMRTGRYYGTAPAVPTPNIAVTQDLLYATPLWVPSSVTLDRIAIFVGVVGSAGSVTRLGIYNDDGNGLPGTLLLDAGTVVTDVGTGAKEITISQAVTAGLYWLAASPQVAAAPQTYGNGVTALTYGATTVVGMMVTNCFAVAGVTGALPASYGTVAHAADGVRVVVRVA